MKILTIISKGEFCEQSPPAKGTTRKPPKLMNGGSSNETEKLNSVFNDANVCEVLVIPVLRTGRGSRRVYPCSARGAEAVYTCCPRREGKPCTPVLRTGRGSRVYPCSALGGETKYNVYPSFASGGETGVYTCTPLGEGKPCIPVLRLGRGSRVFSCL